MLRLESYLARNGWNVSASSDTSDCSIEVHIVSDLAAVRAIAPEDSNELFPREWGGRRVGTLSRDGIVYVFYEATHVLLQIDLARKRLDIWMDEGPISAPEVMQLGIGTFLEAVLMSRGIHFAHAACVAHGGAGLILYGESNQGKSTLTSTLVGRGLHFLADDHLGLRERDGRIEALRSVRWTALWRSGVAFFGSSGPRILEISSPVWADERDKIEFPIAELFPDRMGTVCVPRCLVRLRLEKEGPLELSEAEKEPLLHCLISSAGLRTPFGDENRRIAGDAFRQLQILSSLVESVECFELRYSFAHLDEAASRLSSLLTRA